MAACAVLVILAAMLVPGCAAESGTDSQAVTGPSSGAAGSAPVAKAQNLTATLSCPFTTQNILRYGIWLIGEPDAQASDCVQLNDQTGTVYSCFHNYSIPNRPAYAVYGRIHVPKQVNGCTRKAYTEWCESTGSATGCYFQNDYMCGGATNDVFATCHTY